MTGSIQKRINVLMISHMFPRPGASKSGIFLKNQLEAYTKFVNIFLYVPVHVVPSIFKLRQQKGIRAKLQELQNQIKMNILWKLPAFSTPVIGKYIRYASIPPKEILPFSGGILLFLILLFSIKLKNRYDVVHGQTPLPDGLAAVLLAKVLKRPSIVTVRGSDIHSIKKDSITYFTTQYVLKNTTRVTSVSQDLKSRVMATGIDKGKIDVITNGVNPKIADKNELKDIRKEFKIPANSRILTFIGILTGVKDPLMLLKAFGQISKDENNVYLLFVGSGELEGALKNYAKEHNLTQKVRFTESFVSNENIPSYINSSDLICIPSLREGWPNVLFETMALGKPIVATNVGGIPEAVCCEDYGLLVPPRKPELFAEAVLKALGKKWDHQKIKDYAMDNTWDKVGKRYYEVYRDLLFETNR